MSITTIKSDFKSAICPLSSWATNSTVGDKITLARSFKDFPMLIIKLGWGDSGYAYEFISSDLIDVGNVVSFSNIRHDGLSSHMAITFNSNTEVEITNISGSQIPIRQIYGVY